MTCLKNIYSGRQQKRASFAQFSFFGNKRAFTRDPRRRKAYVAPGVSNDCAVIEYRNWRPLSTGNAYMSFVSSSLPLIQPFARMTGRRSSRPKASAGMR